jgi:hypothetical protein
MSEEILQGNQLIAEFMGQTFAHAYYLKYHKDWNELMPVVEKIESLGYDVTIDGKRCYITYGDYGTKTYEHIADEECQSKLEAVYNAVIQFIHYYNSNK